MKEDTFACNLTLTLLAALAKTKELPHPLIPLVGNFLNTNLYMSGRVALVTGGATRIGAATAKALHRDGYRVAIHYRSSREGAVALAEELNSERAGSAAIFSADLGLWRRHETGGVEQNLPGVCDALIAEVTNTFGDLHVLVNNASAFTKTPLLLLEDELGESGAGDAQDRNLDDEEALFVSNALAPFYLTRSFARYVQRQQLKAKQKTAHIVSSPVVEGAESGAAHPEGEGFFLLQKNSTVDRCVILFGDSLVSRCPHKTYGVYSLAKIGAENFAQTASTELAPIGIRVNCVRPGFNVFPPSMPEDERDKLRSLVPLRQKEGEPQDVARAICFLVDPDRAGYLSGTMLDVDGALRHVAIS